MAQVAGRAQPIAPANPAIMSPAPQAPWSNTRLPHNLHTSSGGKNLPDTTPPTYYDRPPTPPLKDSPSTPRTPMPGDKPSSTMASSTDLSSYFRPGPLSRAGSIYSLSRVSFTNQISQLTAIHLPDAASLKAQISAIATSTAASRALSDAADQIQSWIQKASDVLDGLDAGDDADWAAAAGRDGLAEVDQAITRFEALVSAYVSAVEELQLRNDANVVPPEDVKSIVAKVEKITTDWQHIKKTLGDVKHQVELALEWEQLGDVDLGEIATEIEDLSRLIFEMEERRHNSSAGFLSTQDQGLDLEELETIVHEAPQQAAAETPTHSKHFGAALDLQSSPLQSPTAAKMTDESSVLGLFARMQPLRATLDFLPIKLSAFKDRAMAIFPSACDQLDDRRDTLEGQWKKLEDDAECLRRELGEDRWNLVFRNAGKQALKLIDSVQRSLAKVDESLGHDTHLQHATSTMKKIENYEAKKTHYCPAIDRVLSIIERGVKDRLTMNGEIIRLRADIRQKWQTLQLAIKHMDTLLEEYATERPASVHQQQLRDSLSSIISTERSLDNSALLTPGSSPPSSVVSSRSRRQSMQEARNLALRIKPSLATEAAGQVAPEPAVGRERRNSSLPLPAHKSPVTRSSAVGPAQSSSSKPSSMPSSSRSTPKSASQPARPRWNYSKQSGEYDVGQYYASLKAKAAARKTLRQSSQSSTTSISSPLSSPTVAGSILAGRTSSRPPLSRKSSNLSLATESNPVPRASSNIFINPRASRDSSPLSVRKRTDNMGHGAVSSPPTRDPNSPPSLHATPRTANDSGSRPRTPVAGLPRQSRGRSGSMLPLPADRARAASAMRMSGRASDALHHAADEDALFD